MNTPAHVVINLLCLGRQDRAIVLTPVVIGAILPDTPMFLFYFVEKVVRGTPEFLIWTQAYHQVFWQNLIDLFHSLPLMAMGWLMAAWTGSTIGMLLFGSMVFHVFGDLPLHHDDAHRHFFPFSDWRFESPVSYWDPNYYGNIISVLELVAVIISCIILFRIYKSRFGKFSIAMIGGSYLLYLVYVFTIWA